MRTRFQFVPTLDAMPYRIAPTTAGIAIAAHALVATPQVITASPLDNSTEPGEDSGTSGPIIISPIPPGPPTTLPC